LGRHLKFATPINREHATQAGVRNYALLFVGAVLFHIAGTWSLPLIDRDEPRFAEASREMRSRGDFVIPYFNNQFRFDKPPLTYWAQAMSYQVFGDNDFAARFPSAIAAALIAVTLLAWGSQIGGEKLGWWAAIIFSLSLQTFVHAKAAVADMWLVLFVTLAHWSGYELLRDKLLNTGQRSTLNVQRSTSNGGRVAVDRIWWWAFYLALALAFLAKGPIGWAPLLTLAATKIFYRDLGLSQGFKFGRGILFMLAVVSLWGIPALLRTHGDFFWIGIGRHVIGRSFAAMEGHGANSFGVYLLMFPFYFITVFASFFPWSLKLPRLCHQLWHKRDWTDTYLLCGIAIIFLIFTLVKTKLPHYTLPAFPLLALLLGQLLIAEVSTQFWKRAAMATAGVYLAIALVVPPFIVPLFPAAALFRQSRDYLRPEMEFGAIEFAEPSLVWYFRSRIAGWMTPLRRGSATRFMEKPGPRFVVAPTAQVEKIFPSVPVSWKKFSTHGFNIPNGKAVDLTLLLKPD
jgi:4-amino-4-deoxy-L-arabinose transferase-like glycosyltransferase